MTKQPVLKRKDNKGQQFASRLTINGRVNLRRRWWHAAGDGSECPADGFLSPPTDGVSRGVREMACRENKDASSFDTAAENLARTAQVTMSGEQLRQIVEAEGRRIIAAQDAGALPPAFQAEDCVVSGETTTRLYVGVDGVMYSLISLHPEIQLKFSNYDINALDEAGKLSLLSDIRAILGIPELKSESL